MDIIHGEENMLPRVSSVQAEPDYVLNNNFHNGKRKKYDAKPLLNISVCKNLAKVFSSARVEFGTLVWSGDMDISPDTLYLRSIKI